LEDAKTPEEKKAEEKVGADGKNVKETEEKSTK